MLLVGLTVICGLFVIAHMVSDAGDMDDDSAGEGGGPPGGKGRMPMWRTSLATLSNPSLHDELKLTPEQRTKFATVIEDLGRHHQGAVQRFQSMAPGPRRDAALELSQQVGKEAREGLNACLQPEQRRRLDEIQLQLRGPQAFADAAIQSALGLTAQQIATLATINESMRQEIQAVFGQGGAGNAQQSGAKAVEIRKAHRQKLLAVLTDRQKQTWEAMLGQPFKLQPRGGPGGPGGRGGPGGPGGPGGRGGRRS